MKGLLWGTKETGEMSLKMHQVRYFNRDGKLNGVAWGGSEGI